MFPISLIPTAALRHPLLDEVAYGHSFDDESRPAVPPTVISPFHGLAGRFRSQVDHLVCRLQHRGPSHPAPAINR